MKKRHTGQQPNEPTNDTSDSPMIIDIGTKKRHTGKLPTGENTNDACDPLVIIDPFQPDIPADRALTVGDLVAEAAEKLWNAAQDEPAAPEEMEQHRPWWKLW